MAYLLIAVLIILCILFLRSLQRDKRQVVGIEKVNAHWKPVQQEMANIDRIINELAFRKGNLDDSHEISGHLLAISQWFNQADLWDKRLEARLADELHLQLLKNPELTNDIRFRLDILRRLISHRRYEALRE